MAKKMSNPKNHAKKPSASPAIKGLAAKLKKDKAAKEQDKAPHIIVRARAGTGKTTTMIEGLKYLRGEPTKINPSPQQQAIWESLALSKGIAKTICFVAFNKSIATELQSRVPQGCEAMTMHSMGYRAVREALGGVRVNNYRVQDILAELLEGDSRDLRRKQPVLCGAVDKLVGLCKVNLVQGESVEELQTLADYYDIELNGCAAKVYELVPKVLERCRDVSQDRCVDFADMIWLPVALNLPVYRYDLLLVDEAQDLNRCQQALALKAGNRIVMVGDDRQAIYGFAGADCESLDRMIQTLKADPARSKTCTFCQGTGEEQAGDSSGTCWGCAGSGETAVVVLPLTVTRRCGKAIVTKAQEIVPDFEAHEEAPEGFVGYDVYPVTKAGREIDWQQCYASNVQDGDMVLCRVNAPLVSQYFRFLKRGIRANIQGRDIGQNISNLVKKLKATNIADLVEKVEQWSMNETLKEQKKKNPNEAKLIAILDKADCVLAFAEGSSTIDDMLRKIEEVFTDDRNGNGEGSSGPRRGIRLSSIHKAKGLEADNVYLLLPDGAGCPHPMARSAWQQSQEFNILYVAITRARHKFIYVLQD